MHRLKIDQIIRQHLASREDQNRYRRRRLIQSRDSVHGTVGSQPFINFASNDYLGLSRHPAVLAAMRDAIIGHGAGSGAAGLISGYSELHAAAETKLAGWKGSEATVLLPSGYQANHAAIQTLAAIGEATGGGVRFLLDKLSHASLIDAIRGSGAPLRVFPHNGIVKLRRLLADAPDQQLQVVVTESIFSMDGDAAALEAIAALKEEFNCLLLLDEAHGSGVYGPRGNGYAAEIGHGGIADVSVVTFSKAMGLMGGAVCASVAFCEMLVNHARAYIYSTSVAPALAGGVIAAIDVIEAEPQRRQRVRQLAQRVRAELRDRNITIGGLADSPIVPVILRDEQATLTAADRLLQQGMLVGAVRPPTVPPGSSRIRVTLSSDHGDEEVARLCVALADLNA